MIMPSLRRSVTVRRGTSMRVESERDRLLRRSSGGSPRPVTLQLSAQTDVSVPLPYSSDRARNGHGVLDGRSARPPRCELLAAGSFRFVRACRSFVSVLTDTAAADAGQPRPSRWADPWWPDQTDPWWPADLEKPMALDPGAISGLYRALRKSREDAKDEPGAADFYYGEM